MDCLRFEQLVQRYWDDDLGPVHARLVREHAAGCGPCRSTLAEYGTLFEALRHLERVAAPADLEPAVLACLDVRASCPPLGARILRGLVHPGDVLPSPAQMGVAVALVLGVLILGAGRMDDLGGPVLQALGGAATWTYVRITGIVAGAATGFLTDTWPMLRHTAGTLGGALRLLREAHGLALGTSLGLCVVLLLGAALLVRPRSGGRAPS